jgi:hypothetical protein
MSLKVMKERCVNITLTKEQIKSEQFINLQKSDFKPQRRLISRLDLSY